MARDLTLEPPLPVNEIQGDILIGLPKLHEHLIFFEIVDAVKFKAFLKTLDITSVQECLDKRQTIADNKAKGVRTLIPTPGLNIAFTFRGLGILGVGGLNAASPEFINGMAASQAKLNDSPSGQWTILQPSNSLHGVFIVTGSSHAEVVDVISLRLVPAAGNGWHLRHEEVGQVRPDPVRGHEHFGYADGVSQPGIRGTIGTSGAPLTSSTGTDENQGERGQDLLWPGEFIFGYPEQKPAGPLEEAGPPRQPPVPFMQDGAYLVFRRLAQLVPEFNASVKQASASIGGGADTATPTLLGAQMVGRWKSGAPVILTPTQDNPSFAEGTIEANNFEFGDDRDGLKCPWAAHVRKVYPRDDVPGNLTPTNAQVDAAEAFTQTHRMLRRGIAFGPEVTADEAKQQQSAGGNLTRGLLFKCYNTSIEDQFEFVQQSWSNTINFSQPNSGVDPIIGQSAAPLRPFLGAAPVSENAANKPQLQLRGFVHLQGGAYFFAPSITQLKAL